MAIVINGTGTITGISATNGLADPQTGSVLQVVTFSTSATTSTSSTSYVATSLTATITPKFSTSKILVFVNGGELDTSGNSQAIYGTIYRNSTNLAGAAGTNDAYGTSSRIQVPISAAYLDSPATTSATTYTFYLKTGGSYTVYLNANAVTCTINLLEIAA